MRIERIIQDKGDDVVTIKPGATIADAAAILSQKRIGAVIVCEDGPPQGILSERDIVRRLGEQGAGCMDMKVSELMTTSLKTCSKTDLLDEVLAQMTQGRFRHMPVMEGDRMIGLVSIGDVVKSRLNELAHERDALEGMVTGSMQM